MASGAKDLQMRELKDTVLQLKTMVSEQTELIKSLRLIIDEKSNHEKALQEQVDYLTKKLLVLPAKGDLMTSPATRIFLMKQRRNRIHPCWRKKPRSGNIPARKRQPIRNFSKAFRLKK